MAESETPAPVRRYRLIAGSLALAAGSLAADWVPHNNGLTSLNVMGISVDPLTPSTVYLHIRDQGAYKSTDGGASWLKSSSGLPDASPGYGHLVRDGIAVDPTDTQVLYACSSGKVYKSADAAASWSLSSTGTTINGHDGVHGVVIDPGNHLHLYGGTIASGADGGVVESWDGGASWTNIAGSNVPGSGLGNDAWPVEIDPSNPLTMYCGSPHDSVYRSTDGGHTWAKSDPLGSGDHSTYEVTANPGVAGQVWISHSVGTFVSADYGQTWVERSDFSAGMLVLRFAPSDAEVAYCLTLDQRLYRSDDSGGSWSVVYDEPLGGRTLAVDPTDPDVVYLGSGGKGLYKSTDGGLTFVEANVGLPLYDSIYVGQTFADPAVPGRLYCNVRENGLYVSADAGASWDYYASFPTAYQSRIYLDPLDTSRWFYYSGDLYLSSDSGLTWESVYSVGEDTDVAGMSMTEATPPALWVCERSQKKVAVSYDRGDTWTVRDGPQQSDNIYAGMAADPNDPDVVAISCHSRWSGQTNRGYVWRTTNGGASWTQTREGLFTPNWWADDGYWYCSGNVMRQWWMSGGYALRLTDGTYGDGSYEARVRITDTLDGNTMKWAGFICGAPTEAGNHAAGGYLAGVRRNGELFLWNVVDGTVISAPGFVADPMSWTTIRLEVSGWNFTLYANGDPAGAWTDAAHLYGDGHFKLVTSGSEASFDDVHIDSAADYDDAFSHGTFVGAHFACGIEFDPHAAGVCYLRTQWGGAYISEDSAATWRKITGQEDWKLFWYFTPSRVRPGTAYVCSGYGYDWDVWVVTDLGDTWQRIGGTVGASLLYIGEDRFDADRLYTGGYEVGALIYDGPIPGTDPLIAARAPLGFYNQGWNLTSLPVAPVDPEPTGAFHDLWKLGNTLTFNLYRYDPVAGYGVYPQQFADVELGLGYWLNLLVGCPPDAVVECVGWPATSDPALPLLDGWCLLGHPSTEAVALADCVVSDGESQLPYAEAVAAGWLQSIAYYYDGGGYGMVGIAGGDDDSLRPFRGYWFLTYRPGLTLIVPLP